MADGTLHAAGGGHVALGNLRIKAFCDGIDVAVVRDGQQDGIAQELIALDVGRHTDLVQDLGDRQLVTVERGKLWAGCVACGLQHTADQHGLVKRLDEEERKSAVQQLLLDLLALEGPGNEEGRAGAAGVLSLVALLYSDGVQVRHKGIQQHSLRMDRQQGLQSFGTVLFADGH